MKWSFLKIFPVNDRTNPSILRAKTYALKYGGPRARITELRMQQILSENSAEKQGENCK
jgi:hypothetical protein